MSGQTVTALVKLQRYARWTLAFPKMIGHLTDSCHAESLPTVEDPDQTALCHLLNIHTDRKQSFPKKPYEK